jgi:hypothetical protein
MRELILAALLAGCPAPAPYTGSAAEGACDEAAAQCVDERTIQYCDGGQWADPEACPPQETEVGSVATYCFEAGFCGPG